MVKLSNRFLPEPSRKSVELPSCQERQGKAESGSQESRNWDFPAFLHSLLNLINLGDLAVIAFSGEAFVLNVSAWKRR
jgi:hypothetical protein